VQGGLIWRERRDARLMARTTLRASVLPPSGGPAREMKGWLRRGGGGEMCRRRLSDEVSAE